MIILKNERGRMITFFNKNVLIAGATGLSRNFALEVAKDRANIGIFHSDKNELIELERELGNHRIRNYGYRCDLSSKEDLAHAVALYKKQFEMADYLLININLHDGKDIIDMSFDEVEKEISSSVDGTICLVKYFIPEIVKKQSGGFIFAVNAKTLSPVGAAALGAIEKFSAHLNSFFHANGLKDVFSTVAYVSETKTNASDLLKKAVMNGKKIVRI